METETGTQEAEGVPLQRSYTPKTPDLIWLGLVCTHQDRWFGSSCTYNIALLLLQDSLRCSGGFLKLLKIDLKPVWKVNICKEWVGISARDCRQLAWPFSDQDFSVSCGPISLLRDLVSLVLIHDFPLPWDQFLVFQVDYIHYIQFPYSRFSVIALLSAGIYGLIPLTSIW